jgi:hypothetical protein
LLYHFHFSYQNLKFIRHGKPPMQMYILGASSQKHTPVQRNFPDIETSRRLCSDLLFFNASPKSAPSLASDDNPSRLGNQATGFQGTARIEVKFEKTVLSQSTHEQPLERHTSSWRRPARRSFTAEFQAGRVGLAMYGLKSHGGRPYSIASVSLVFLAGGGRRQKLQIRAPSPVMRALTDSGAKLVIQTPRRKITVSRKSALEQKQALEKF